MSDTFLRPDGIVEWRPAPEVKARLRADGATVYSRGQLCTACLVGSWPQTLLRFAQTVCPTCQRLDAEVTARSGLEHPSRAGRLTTAVADPARLNDPADTAWDPVRQARAVRARRLGPVFVQARSLGVVLVEEHGVGRAPVELVACDALDRPGLIPSAMEDRVRRYAAWLEELAPDDFTERAAAFDDVDSLAAVLRSREREARVARARAELARARRDAARAPRALAEAAAELVRAAGRAVR